MSYIKTIAFEDAEGSLKKIYQKVKGPNNQIDNILKAHSLRPHTLTGHMAIYKNVLHNSNNTLPKWYLETLGVYVSMLNDCRYCIVHHFEGLKKLIADDVQSEKIELALAMDSYDELFEQKLVKGLYYAKHLTLDAGSIEKKNIESLQQGGLTDGEILEINQVVSYFNYANRTVLGLGVNPDGELLGLSPNDSSDESNWSHS